MNEQLSEQLNGPFARPPNCIRLSAIPLYAIFLSLRFSYAIPICSSSMRFHSTMPLCNVSMRFLSAILLPKTFVQILFEFCLNGTHTSRGSQSIGSFNRLHRKPSPYTCWLELWNVKNSLVSNTR